MNCSVLRTLKDEYWYHSFKMILCRAFTKHITTNNCQNALTFSSFPKLYCKIIWSRTAHYLVHILIRFLLMFTSKNDDNEKRLKKSFCEYVVMVDYALCKKWENPYELKKGWEIEHVKRKNGSGTNIKITLIDTIAKSESILFCRSYPLKSVYLFKCIIFFGLKTV